MRIGWQIGCSLISNKTPSHDEIPNQQVLLFRIVSFDNWLRLFMQHCFILMKRGQYDVAEEILRHIMVSNAYPPQDRQKSIRIALITCSIFAATRRRRGTRPQAHHATSIQEQASQDPHCPPERV
ncbi:hypothetical protein BJ165DRAFT_1512112 [Panaeolus papilionaceus]|nr:hypothetical protein BJ165DRAFT_1512112 [Panaeolus papilionaceus]